ncbi:MAG: purine-nucleoside phosphorylase [Candidatus Xenobium sp.]|jgi:purine-nucleoside phosphorylase|nr:purine-nucleoside phosphorylase [Burkholderiales bacterium]
MPIPKTTPHISCTAEQFARTVIMPGDPMRSRFIAENHFENPILINNVRGVQGYTGTWQGKKVTVMASGMGVPSMGIYSYELFNFMGVETIVRIGTCGGMQASLSVGNLVLAQGACTNSNYASQFRLPGTYAPLACFKLLRAAVEAAERLDIPVAVGNVLTTDYFYDDSRSTLDWAQLGVLACEMEAAALYTNAAQAGKQALAILTVSDNLLTGEAMTPAQRETTLGTMIGLALEIA